MHQTLGYGYILSDRFKAVVNQVTSPQAFLVSVVTKLINIILSLWTVMLQNHPQNAPFYNLKYITYYSHSRNLP